MTRTRQISGWKNPTPSSIPTPSWFLGVVFRFLVGVFLGGGVPAGSVAQVVPGPASHRGPAAGAALPGPGAARFGAH